MFTPKSLSTTGLVKSVNDRWQTFTVGLVMNSVCIWCKDNAYKEWYSGLVCLRIKSHILRTGCCARGRFVPEEKKRSHFFARPSGHFSW